MADITVKSAFVEDVLTHEGRVWGLRTSETHARKVEGGGYETTARTFRTVKVARDSGIDLSGHQKGDRVSFVGVEKTEKREKDGKTFYDLVVWATEVSVIGGGGQANGAADTWAVAQPGAAQSDAWASDETPF